MQEEIDVNYALSKYQAKLIDQLNSCFGQIKSTHDPLGFMVSEKGRWIFNNPLLKSDQKANVLHLATMQLNQKLHDANDQYRCNHDANLIYFYLANRQVISWKLSTNQVSVPLFKTRYENQAKIKVIKEKMNANQQELAETQVVLSNPDALINRGMLVAYLKATFTKKRYQAESQAVIDNLNADQSELQAELKGRNELEHDLTHLTNEIAKLTHQIELITTGFPYHITYDKYLAKKEQNEMNVNEK